MSRRTKSLHHNLKNKNIPFHREHRSKRNRRFIDDDSIGFKKKREALRMKELEND